MSASKFRLLSAASAVLPLAAALSACGGGDKKAAPDDWVRDLCDAAGDFREGTDRATERLFDLASDDAPAAKKALQEIFKDVDARNDDCRDAFEKLGTPDIDGGPEVVKAFEDEFKRNDGDLQKAREQVDKIDTDKDFDAQLETIFATDDSGNFFDRLEAVADDKPEAQQIIEAIEDNEDCADVLFEGSSEDDDASDPPPAAGGTPRAGATARPTANSANLSTNERWVAGICTSLGDWVNDIVSAEGELQAAIDSSASAQDLKKELVDFLKTGQEETRNLRREVSALKAPDVKDGGAIHGVFTKATGDFVTLFDRTVADAEKIDASSLSKVTADLDRFSVQVGESFTGLGAAFDELDRYDAGELDDLFESRPECADLGG